MELPLARQTMARAQRMLDDLSRHADDEVGFRDRLPYVLDLLAGVTRCINDESKGYRSSQFGSWWKTADRTMQEAIQELRNAELKRAESRAKQEVRVEMRGPGGTPLPAGVLAEGVRMEAKSLTESQFSIVVSTEWRFADGDLDGRPVLPALAGYWNEVGEVLAQAEGLLGE
jgi:hypothetical protein